MPESHDIVTSFEPPKKYGSESLGSLVKEFKLFTFAPLYVYLNVPFDIPAQFRAEVEDFPHINVGTDKPVILNCSPQYAYFLEGIQQEAATKLASYAKNMTILDRRTGLYSEVTWVDIPIKQVLPDAPENLQFSTYAIFLPNSNKFSLKINYDDNSTPYIVSGPASVDVFNRGKKVLDNKDEVSH